MPEGKPRPYTALARRIIDARTRARLSQPELARQANVSTGYIGLIEMGSRRPSADVLRALARVLEIPYAELAVLADYADPPQGDAVIAVNQDEARLISWLREAGKAGQYVSPRRALDVLRALYRSDDELFVDLAGDVKRRHDEA